MLSFETAEAQLLSSARILTKSERVPLSAALGRVLACALRAPVDVPGFDNSAMDGYALHVADFEAPPASFSLVGRIAAGEVGSDLLPGEAARIFTGAPVPRGANSVQMQEICRADAGRVSTTAPVLSGANIRRRGEDIAHGQLLLDAGCRLTPQALGVLAAVGIGAVTVYAPLKVALLSTGSELTEPGQALGNGKIYNSNRYVLYALLNELGFSVSDCGIVPDQAAATVTALERAARTHDVVITTGGVSVGEEDHVKAAVQALGQLDLWKVGIKPGKPLAFGQLGDADFIGLPGNPMACYVAFMALARGFLLKRQGLSRFLPVKTFVPAAVERYRSGNRREFLCARLNEAGQVDWAMARGSGMLSGLLGADGLAEIPENVTVCHGDPIAYWRLNDLR